MDSYLYQWYGGTVLCISNIECMISIEQDGCIEIKIRGPKSSSYTCFYFLEEILHSINLVNKYLIFLFFINSPITVAKQFMPFILGFN